MWRSTRFPENEDSDLSITEDDDLNGDFPEDHVSLGVPAEKKGEVQVLSQLDMLRDAHEVTHERNPTSLLQKRQSDFCIEDDVEFPRFADKGVFTYPPRKASAYNSDEEILSDNEGQEKDELKSYVTPAELPVSRTHTTTSMAELLVGIQDEHVLPEGSTTKYNKTKGAPEKHAVKRRVLSRIDRNIDDDPDCLGSDPSDEDEYNHQIVELGMPESKPKTIADQFQEALGAASLKYEGRMYAVPRHMGFGLFGKLQRVMQSDKERDLYFLNKLQTEDEVSCFDVMILSRSLEAKLTVCSCSSIENAESSKRRELTIIFSSRICSDVELEVGTLIRVHPPWKEVNVKGKAERLILSTYFSQI